MIENCTKNMDVPTLFLGMNLNEKKQRLLLYAISCCNNSKLSKYVFKAEGDITIDGVTESGFIHEEINVFAPLPLVGIDFLFSF
jgi:hypothetical protein